MRFGSFRKRPFDWLAYTLIVLAGLLRLKTFLQGRSLFLDEANLALNIVERPFLGFFQPLDYEQYAPPFFLIIEKLNWLLFGPQVLSLRLWPLLASLLLLVGFYGLLRQHISLSYLRLLPLFILAFSIYFVRYATEVKPYGTDALCTVLLIYLAGMWTPNAPSQRFYLRWLLIGSGILWLSMPSAFVLGGVGLYYSYTFYRAGQTKALIRFGGVILGWLVSFAGYYFSILRMDLDREALLQYHTTYFLPLLPTNLAEAEQLGRILLSIFHTATGFTTLAYLISTTLFTYGAYVLLRHRFANALLCLTPILLCLLASGLQLYSLIPRLTLFMIPVVLLVIGIGFEGLWRKSITVLRWPLAILALTLLPLQKGYRYFFEPLYIDESVRVLDCIANQSNGDEIALISHAAKPVFLFYTQHTKHLIATGLKQTYFLAWDEAPMEALTQWPTNQKVWLIYAHLVSDEARKRKDMEVGRISEDKQIQARCEEVGAAAYLFGE